MVEPSAELAAKFKVNGGACVRIRIFTSQAELEDVVRVEWMAQEARHGRVRFVEAARASEVTETAAEIDSDVSEGGYDCLETRLCGLCGRLRLAPVECSEEGFTCEQLYPDEKCDGTPDDGTPDGKETAALEEEWNNAAQLSAAGVFCVRFAL